MKKYSSELKSQNQIVTKVFLKNVTSAKAFQFSYLSKVYNPNVFKIQIV